MKEISRTLVEFVHAAAESFRTAASLIRPDGVKTHRGSKAVLGGTAMAFLGATLPVAQRAAAQIQYTVVWPQIPGTSVAQGTNTSGQVVGYFRQGNSQHGFVWSANEGLRDLGGESYAAGINDNGQVVGWATVRMVYSCPCEDARCICSDNGFIYDMPHAFWWTSGGLGHDLGAGGVNSQASAIDSTGHIVGNYVADWYQGSPNESVIWTIGVGSQNMGLSSGSAPLAISPNGHFVVGVLVSGHAFLWNPTGGVQDIGAMGGTSCFPHGVNDSGQVVGRVFDNGSWSAFSWTSAGGVRRVNALNHAFAAAYAVNNEGVIVGTLAASYFYNILDMAFIEVDGVTYDLNSLTAPSALRMEGATAISSDGKVAGYGRDYTDLPSSLIHAFALTPCQTVGITGPSPTATCPSGTAEFAVIPAGTAPSTYQWQWRPTNGQFANIIDGVNVDPQGGVAVFTATNSTASEVTVHPVGGSGTAYSHWDMRCIVTNSCGSVTSNPATLTICVADTDDGSGTGTCDGGVTIDDLLYYLRIFEDGSLTADVDDGTATGMPDGGVTIDDLLYFLIRFEAGC